jgi:P4 family phage/plasmid primase-like protien
MADAVKPAKKDVNDREAEGTLPDDMLDGEPMVFDSIPPPADKESPPEDEAPLPDPPPMPGDDAADPDAVPDPPDKKSGGKGGKLGGRVTDARVIYMRPEFARGDQAEMADKLAVVLAPDKSLLVHDEGHQYVYSAKSGAWEMVPNEVLRAIVKNFAGCKKKTKEGYSGLIMSHGAAIGAVRFLADETHATDFFEDGPPGAAFMNGFVTCSKGVIEIRENEAGNRARFTFPFDYDPNLKHPMLDSFFEEVFENCSEDERGARICLLQEAAGAALFGMATTYQKALLMFGPGGSGKSQFAEIMFAILPKFMCSATPPHKWGERFAVSSLVGVALNIVAELPAVELVTTEVFKSVITGDYIDAERKFMPSFRFKAKAMHIFMANTLPPTRDFTDAFFRRFVICPFERNMITAPNHVEDIGKKIALAEREAIVAWAIEGAIRLQKQGKYTTPDMGAETLARWRVTSDNVALFVEECCEPPEGDDIRDGTKATVLYGRYKEWAKNSGYETMGYKNFASRMELLKLKARRIAEGNYYPVVSKLRDPL